MEKLLHERLREHDDTNTGSWYHTIRMFDNWELKLSKHGADSLADEIERYYIPRPRFEDGEPVQFEDAFSVPNITPDRRCKGIVYLVDGSYKLVDGMLESYRFDDCSRPTPKVCDADGVEIKVGDTVYDTLNATDIIYPKTVERITDEHRILCKNNVGLYGHYLTTELTHERPVFDAEGDRVKIGDTVWYDTDPENARKVVAIANVNEPYGWIAVEDAEGRKSATLACAITHREPDSLEKLYADMRENSDNGKNDDPNTGFGFLTHDNHLERFHALIERGA